MKAARGWVFGVVGAALVTGCGSIVGISDLPPEASDASTTDSTFADSTSPPDGSHPDSSVLDSSVADAFDATDAFDAFDAYDSADAALPVCSFNVTSNPCGKSACISGGLTSCSWPNCGGNQSWGCLGGQVGGCGGGNVCCAPAMIVSGVGPSCAQGSISINQNLPIASACTAAPCANGAPQLCALDLDCPPQTHCVSAKITNGPTALVNHIVGICAQ